MSKEINYFFRRLKSHLIHVDRIGGANAYFETQWFVLRAGYELGCIELPVWALRRIYGKPSS
jgi:hypothetical protein